jgi:hypothetical protein
MTTPLKFLFLAVVMRVMVMLFMGIYAGGGPADIPKGPQNTTQSKGFKTLAERSENRKEGLKMRNKNSRRSG